MPVPCSQQQRRLSTALNLMLSSFSFVDVFGILDGPVQVFGNKVINSATTGAN
jgi:hypothetical protein